MTVFLYQIKRRVELTLRETAGLANWNLPMDNNDFKIFRDVQNTIEFIVRDTDRKPINLTDRTLKLTLYDHRNKVDLWQGELRVVNALKGRCVVDIDPDVTADWYLQTYAYTVTTSDQQSTHLLYVDTNETQQGFFELCSGPSQSVRPSHELTEQNFTPVMRDVNGQPTHYLFSSALPGTLQRKNYNGLHTVAVTLDNFSGAIVIQGSLEAGTPSEDEWFDLDVMVFDHYSGQDYTNITANLNWVRFRIENRYPEVEELVLERNRGHVEKLVFRN